VNNVNVSAVKYKNNLIIERILEKINDLRDMQLVTLPIFMEKPVDLSLEKKIDIISLYLAEEWGVSKAETEKIVFDYLEKTILKDEGLEVS